MVKDPVKMARLFSILLNKLEAYVQDLDGGDCVRYMNFKEFYEEHKTALIEMYNDIYDDNHYYKRYKKCYTILQDETVEEDN